MIGDPSPPKTTLKVTQPGRTAEPAIVGKHRIDSATLLGPGGELFIDHQQQVYRLRVTSLGKLILTK